MANQVANQLGQALQPVDAALQKPMQRVGAVPVNALTVLRAALQQQDARQNLMQASQESVRPGILLAAMLMDGNLAQTLSSLRPNLLAS